MSASIPLSTLSNIVIQAFARALIDFSDKAKIILYYPANLYPQSHSESENIMFQKGAKLAAILAVSCYNYPVDVGMA